MTGLLKQFSDDLLAVDEALGKLEATNPLAATLVKMRYFAGFTNNQAAQQLGISPRKASGIWTYARTWLLAEIGDNPLRFLAHLWQ